MKNEMKVLDALQNAFVGKEIESVYNKITQMYDIYMNNEFIGAFRDDFFKHDFENPEIEIKIKAPLKTIHDFVNRAVGYGIIRGAVERGLSEWENESHPNS